MARPVIDLPVPEEETGAVEYLRELHDPDWRRVRRDPALVDLLHRLARVLGRETDVDVGFEPQPQPTFRLSRGRRDIWLRPQAGAIWLREGSAPDEHPIEAELSWDERSERYVGDPMLALVKGIAPHLWPERFEDEVG